MTADNALMQFTSHIEGINARVAIFPDRIEWEKRGVSAAKVKAGIVTMGISTMFTGVRSKSTDMIPIRQITSVVSQKGSGFNTVVAVRTGAGVVEMRVSHGEAEKIRSLLNELMMSSGTVQYTPPPPLPAAAPPAPDITAQITQLASLRDQGILTEAEFAAKKTDLLARM